LTPRLASPDPSVLQRAVGALSATTALPAARWSVERRIDRPETVTFVIRAAVPVAAPAVLYYKVFYPWPDRRGPNLDLFTREIRDGLTHCETLQDRLAPMGAPEQIQPARVLAADPDRLTVVTLHIPGRPLGKAIRHALTAGRRRSSHHTYRQIGRAARLIEECADPQSEDDSAELDRSLNLIDRLRDRKALHDRELDVLRDRMVDLYRRALAPGGSRSRVHGDLTSSNVLTRPGQIGLIDFTWPVRLRGHDVYRFVTTLERARPGIPKWIQALVGSVLEGYGDPEIVNSPSWAFKRAHGLLADIARERCAAGCTSAIRRLRTAL
jgi:hypothetical protein